MKQFVVFDDSGEEKKFLKKEDGSCIFDTLEKAQDFAAASGMKDLKFYSREVSAWQFEGDMVSGCKA